MLISTNDVAATHWSQEPLQNQRQLTRAGIVQNDVSKLSKWLALDPEDEATGSQCGQIQHRSRVITNGFYYKILIPCAPIGLHHKRHFFIDLFDFFVFSFRKFFIATNEISRLNFFPDPNCSWLGLIFMIVSEDWVVFMQRYAHSFFIFISSLLKLFIFRYLLNYPKFGCSF